MPNASEEAREEAYATLRELMAILARINGRLTIERREADSTNAAGRLRISDSQGV
ncbi:MAG: hypothetical protein ABL883_08530 [Terricaulis sp.]